MHLNNFSRITVKPYILLKNWSDFVVLRSCRSNTNRVMALNAAFGRRKPKSKHSTWMTEKRAIIQKYVTKAFWSIYNGLQKKLGRNHWHKNWVTTKIKFRAQIQDKIMYINIKNGPMLPSTSSFSKLSSAQT